MRRHIGAIVLGLSLVVVAPGCSRGDRSPSATATRDADLPVFGGIGSPTGTQDRITLAQRRLAAAPHDDSARVYLAASYLQRAREVGDPTFYVKADALLTKLRRDHPSDPQVLLASGTLALARHQFAVALRIARRAVRATPGAAGALGLLVDANNELGRYDDALAATQEMVDAKPNLASLSRVSYARELRGDTSGAIQAMTQAARAGGESGENVAYVRTQLGILLLTDGDLRSAGLEFDRAETAFPGFAPVKVGRARLLVAQQDPRGAADLLAQAAAVQPTAETVILQGDALAAAGKAAEADVAYALVDAIARLYRANGVNTDLEMALFHADHRPGEKSVREARNALVSRPGYLGHEVLAWALHRADHPDDAWAEIRRAIALGNRDPQLRYHAAAIAAARGDMTAARSNLAIVLDQNPRFSARAATDVVRLAGLLGLAVPPPPS